MLVQRNTIKDQIYDLIKDRILSREYKPGHKININALAEECGVSNTPVREALSMMQKERLVTFSTNQGYQVFHITQQENDSFRTMMPLVLLGSYDLILVRGEIDRLNEELGQSLANQAEQVANGSHIDKANAAVEWETAFLRATNSPHVNQYFEFYMTKVVLTVYYDYIYNGTDAKISLDEHTVITNAVKSGNADLVRRLIVEHHDKAMIIDMGGE